MVIRHPQERRRGAVQGPSVGGFGISQDVHVRGRAGHRPARVSERPGPAPTRARQLRCWRCRRPSPARSRRPGTAPSRSRPRAPLRRGRSSQRAQSDSEVAQSRAVQDSVGEERVRSDAQTGRAGMASLAAILADEQADGGIGGMSSAAGGKLENLGTSLSPARPPRCRSAGQDRRH